MSLAIECTGRGPDLVLIHGWGFGARAWDAIAPALARRFRVHAVSLPGYGSSGSASPYSLVGLAEALAEASPPNCLVCGWSMGAQAALAWAHCAPQQVARLALIAATPSFVQREDWPHAVASPVLETFMKALADDHRGTLRRFLALQALGDDRARLVTERFRAGLNGGGRPHPSVLAQGLALLLSTDLRPLLSAIVQPALVLHGDADRVTPLAAGEYLARALPRAQLKVMRGAAHVPFVSHPAEAGALLEEFFDGR